VRRMTSWFIGTEVRALDVTVVGAGEAIVLRSAAASRGARDTIW
jgi:hypothetical protein